VDAISRRFTTASSVQKLGRFRSRLEEMKWKRLFAFFAKAGAVQSSRLRTPKRRLTINVGAVNVQGVTLLLTPGNDYSFFNCTDINAPTSP
jgi:hypothetical protein